MNGIQLVRFESSKVKFLKKYLTDSMSLKSVQVYRSCLNFQGFKWKEYRDPLHERTGFKSEFGFDTEAATSRSVAKRMFELLNPVLS